MSFSSGAYLGNHSTVSHGRAASALAVALLVWIGPPPLRGRGVEDQHHGPSRPAGPRRVAPVEAAEQVDEVIGALGGAGENDQLAGGVVERAEERAPLCPSRRLDPQVHATAGPAMGQVGVGRRFGFVPEQEADVAGRGLLLQEHEPQAGAIDRCGILPTSEAVARPAPTVAPFRSTTLRWPEEIVSPVRASISRASRAKVQGARSATGSFSTSRAAASAASRLRGVRPDRGRARNAATPARATAERQRRTCSARTPRRDPTAALVSPASDHSTARARSASPRAPERLSRSSSTRPASSTTSTHRRPIAHPIRRSIVRPHLYSCAFISRAA
jgi:hypothetical protein